MKTITDEEIKQIISELAEAPAKYVFNTIMRLQQLKEVEKKEVFKK